MGGPPPLDGLAAPLPEGHPGANWGSKTFLLVWADTAEPVRLTPSVLLAHLILCSRRVRCPVTSPSSRQGIRALCCGPMLMIAAQQKTAV